MKNKEVTQKLYKVKLEVYNYLVAEYDNEIQARAFADGWNAASRESELCLYHAEVIKENDQLVDLETFRDNDESLLDAASQIKELREKILELSETKGTLIVENNTLKEENDKLLHQKNTMTARYTIAYVTLQEIKAIAESAMAKQQEYKKDFEQTLQVLAKAEDSQ